MKRSNIVFYPEKKKKKEFTQFPLCCSYIRSEETPCQTSAHKGLKVSGVPSSSCLHPLLLCARWDQRCEDKKHKAGGQFLPRGCEFHWNISALSSIAHTSTSSPTHSHTHRLDMCWHNTRRHTHLPMKLPPVTSPFLLGLTGFRSNVAEFFLIQILE